MTDEGCKAFFVFCTTLCRVFSTTVNTSPPSPAEPNGRLITPALSYFSGIDALTSFRCLLPRAVRRLECRAGASNTPSSRSRPPLPRIQWIRDHQSLQLPVQIYQALLLREPRLVDCLHRSKTRAGPAADLYNLASTSLTMTAQALSISIHALAWTAPWRKQ